MASVLQLEQDMNFLKHHLDESLLSKYYEDEEYLKEIERHIQTAKEVEPNLPDIEYEYFGLRKTIREDFDKDFISFFKYISDARYVDPIFNYIEDFHQYGQDILPKKMRKAGDFTWNENATVELTMIPRGVGKSVYLMAKAAYALTKDRFMKSIVTHGKKDLSGDNIQLLSKFIIEKHMNIIYKDIFQASIEEYRQTGSKFKRDAVDIKPPNFYFMNPENDFSGRYRKEDSYSASSPKTSDVGKHVSRIFYDDLVNWDTSRSVEATQKLIAYFRSLFALKEHSLDGKNTFKAVGVGTEYYEDSLYHYIRENMMSSVFSMPIEWDYNSKHHYIVNRFNEKYVETWKKELGEDASSQLYMQPRSLDSTHFDVNFDEDRHIINLTEAELSGFRETMIKMQVCDFAYSMKNKKEGDDKSRFTILHILRSNDVIYIYDIYSSFGEDNPSARLLNLTHAQSHDTDLFIADANGTQENLALEIFDLLQKKHLESVTCIPHRTGKVSGSSNKIAIANTTLSQYFLSDMIKVVVTEDNKLRINKVIQQLKGADKGLDIIDCLVYSLIDVNRNNINGELIKARARYRPSRQFDNLKKASKKNSDFKRGTRRRK